MEGDDEEFRKRDRGIRSVNVRRNEQTGKIEHIKIVFGPHYYVILTLKGKRVEFKMGATHHGFTMDASSVGGELDRLIDEIRKIHPDKIHD